MKVCDLRGEQRVSSRNWLIIFGAAALAVLVILNWGYRQALLSTATELDDELSLRLVGLAENLALQIDPDIASGETSVEDFVDLYEIVRQYRRSYGLADVRLLDTTFTDLLNETTDSLAVAIVSRLDYPTFLAAISGFAVASETYGWEDGYYKSAYAPVFSDSGAVAAVVRVEADVDFFALVKVFERGLWLVHGLSLVFVVAVGGLFFWFFRRQAAWERRLLLSEKLLAMGRMASVVAHEIRNPLGIIKATAQRLAQLPPEKQASLLDFIPQEIDRLDRILTGYLQFADIRVQPSVPVAIAETIKNSLARIERRCREKQITCATRGDSNFAVLADGEALGRALDNLLHNAVDASADGGTIIVESRASGSAAQIIVTDEGPGIPKKERKKIFEPFHTTKAHGSGLGLYAARTSLKKMGGELEYRPRGDGTPGSMFIITVPLARTRE